MPKYYETDKFKQLNKRWQEKLKKAGFVDHEEAITIVNPDGPKTDDDRLKTWSSSLFRGRYNATQYEARLTYYRLAGQFLHEHEFENKLEHTVWELHSNGVGLPKIDVITGKKTGKCRRIVAKLAALMMQKLKEDENE